MSRWRDSQTAAFEDMPEHLRAVGLDSSEQLKQEQADWLEANNLTLVDFMSWKRARDPAAKLRPPSRRRWLSRQERVALDAERQREEWKPW